jgi:ketol-acid reductoisomerase
VAKNRTRVYTRGEADPSLLTGARIAVVGYGNQGRAQALNLRDSGLQVLVGNRDDEYRPRAQRDGFAVQPIPDAVAQAQVLFLLLPDEELPAVFEAAVRPHLRPASTLVFASGYTVAFGLLHPPEDADVVLLAPRTIGVGVRERFESGEGFYAFVGVHQDRSGSARARLLALTAAVTGLHKPAIEVSFHQEAVLDLFNEQAFGPAFGRALLTATNVLLDAGLPPEAVLVEMYMSEEMADVYRTMARVGLIRQTRLHSHTSQFGAMSRAIRFLDPKLPKTMRRIYREIASGAFAREWQRPVSRIKLQALRFLASRQKLSKIEAEVRSRLGIEDPGIPGEHGSGNADQDSR